jgi:hypothetical protein
MEFYIQPCRVGLGYASSSGKSFCLLEGLFGMVSSCLMWCPCRKRNDHSFKDHEWTVTDLKDFFFKIFFTGQLPLS